MGLMVFVPHRGGFEPDNGRKCGLVGNPAPFLPKMTLRRFGWGLPVGEAPRPIQSLIIENLQIVLRRSGFSGR
jgi:hypothetical protein